MAQAFLTYDEQSDKLQTEKELSIPDLSYAKNVLQQISYYSLIDGYMVSYHFSEKYGENQAGYLTDTNYNLNRILRKTKY